MKLRHAAAAGYSLIEVMVSVGIGAGLMLALGSSIVSNQRSVRSLETRLEVADLKTRMATLLSNRLSCNANFSGLDANANTDIPFLRQRDSAGTTANRFTVGDRINGKLIIGRMVLMAPVGGSIEPNTSNQMNLRVEVQTTTPHLYGADLPAFDVPVSVSTRDTNTEIENCDAQAPVGLSCRQISSSSGGTNIQLSCPPGYKIVGGGMIDTDGSKTSQFTMPIAPSTANPWGGWRCYNDDGNGTLTCRATCCR